MNSLSGSASSIRELVRSLCALDVEVGEKSSRLLVGDLFLFLLRSSVNLSLNALVSPLRTIGCLDDGVIGFATVFTCFILDCSCSIMIRLELGLFLRAVY